MNRIRLLCFLSALLMTSVECFADNQECVDVNDGKYAASLAMVEMKRHIPSMFESLTQSAQSFGSKERTMTVTFGVNQQKEPVNIRLKIPSGSSLLDQAAIQAVKVGAPYRQPGECYQVNLRYVPSMPSETDLAARSENLAYKPDSFPAVVKSHYAKSPAGLLSPGSSFITSAPRNPSRQIPGSNFIAGFPASSGPTSHTSGSPGLSTDNCNYNRVVRWRNTVIRKIQATWMPSPAMAAKMKFDLFIAQDGRLTQVKQLVSSGDPQLDVLAISKIKLAAPFPTVPGKSAQVLFLFNEPPVEERSAGGCESFPVVKDAVSRPKPTAAKMTQSEWLQLVRCKVQNTLPSTPNIVGLQEIKLQLSIRREGAFSVKLLASSGDRLLDAVVLSKTQAISSFPPVPDGSAQTVAFQYNASIQSTCKSQFSSLKQGLASADPWGAYIAEIQRRIRRNWSPPIEDRSKRVVAFFKIAQDGRLLGIRIQQSSGSMAADEAAKAAIRASAPFRHLPADYKGADIDIQFTFEYEIYGHGSAKLNSRG